MIDDSLNFCKANLHCHSTISDGSKTVDNVTTDYFYAGSSIVSQKTGNEIINFAYNPNGAPYGFALNGTPYYYILNIQGDVTGIYDNSGTVVVNYIYDSWGRLESITGSLAATVGVKNPLRYRGYYYDTEIGLYYLQSRYYDPETGRFISSDSLLIAGDSINGTNMFAYCCNNPVNYSDPTGTETTEAGRIVAALILVCTMCGYIADVAEKNGIDYHVLGDFFDRTVDDDTNIFGLLSILKIGINVMSGVSLEILSNSIGIFFDSVNMSGRKITEFVNIPKAIPLNIVNEIPNALALCTAYLTDKYNPLMSTFDVNNGLLIHAMEVAVDVGVSAFSAKLGAAIGGITGNLLLGTASGFAFYAFTKIFFLDEIY